MGEKGYNYVRLPEIRNRELYNSALLLLYEIFSSVKDLLGDNAVSELKGDNLKVNL